MSMPNDARLYELRATVRDGSVTVAGAYATHGKAAEQARVLLATGDARRVETWRRHGDRADLVSIIGEGRRPAATGAEDRRHPQDQDDEDGVIG